MNKLGKTRCYLAGPMQFTYNGSSWREDIEKFLTEMDVRVFNPYNKTFLEDFFETADFGGELMRLAEAKKFSQIAELMSRTRAHDLRLVDMADFIIAYINTDIYTCGTFEEIFTANRQKKPIYLVVEGGWARCPYWLLGAIPMGYIFDSFISLKRHLSYLDDGQVEFDRSRWKLLKHDFR